MSWLVSHQKEGTWPANYLNKHRDPQDNVGKFMRDAATAYAILGLTEPSRPGLVEIQQQRPSTPRVAPQNGGHATPVPVRSIAAGPFERRP